MAPTVTRTSFNSSRLIRLLSELTTADKVDSRQSFAERLGLWLGWADAIPLSGALDRSSAPGKAQADTSEGLALATAEAAAEEFARVRDRLGRAVDTDTVLAASPARMPARGQAQALTAPRAVATEFSTFRRRHVAHQRDMEASIGVLRIRVREVLGRLSPGLQRLAALDAVLEQILGARESHLLSTVPPLLEKHFERLRQAHETTQDASREPERAAGNPTVPGWLAAYRRDMRAVLHAELEIRLQPVEGLIEALGQR